MLGLCQNTLKPFVYRPVCEYGQGARISVARIANKITDNHNRTKHT